VNRFGAVQHCWSAGKYIFALKYRFMNQGSTLHLIRATKWEMHRQLTIHFKIGRQFWLRRMDNQSTTHCQITIVDLLSDESENQNSVLC
jgi:hypothetical protein